MINLYNYIDNNTVENSYIKDFKKIPDPIPVVWFITILEITKKTKFYLEKQYNNKQYKGYIYKNSCGYNWLKVLNRW